MANPVNLRRKERVLKSLKTYALAACLATLSTLSTIAKPNLSNPLLGISYYIEHWFDTHVMDEKAAAKEDTTKKIKHSLSNHVNFDNIDDEKLKPFIKKQHKKVQSTKLWLKKNSSELKNTIHAYFLQNSNSKPGDIYDFLNTSTNAVCAKLQTALRSQKYANWIINNEIKSMVASLKASK